MTEETKDERAARLNRERVAKHRAKLREQDNLVKVECWIKPENKERLIKYASKLK